MDSVIRKLSDLGLGVDPVDEDGLFSLYEAAGVELEWARTELSFYFSHNGYHVITLPKRYKGAKLVFAGLHEFWHHLSTSGLSFQLRMMGVEDNKDEAECDAFAMIAMMPLERFLRGDFYASNRYEQKILRERTRLYFIYGI